MESRVERRSPDRHLFVVQLLRRIAALALFLAAVLWVLPRVLVDGGLVGPDAQELIQTATEAVQAARTYGAPDDRPPLQGALRELEAARQLARSGRERDARQAAQRATSEAVAAQHQALVKAADARKKAQAAYDELDREVNELEKRYSAVTEGMDRARTSELFSMMKATRATAGAVFLAFEQRDYERVIASEARARAAVGKARERLTAAGRGDGR
ncbi:MAG TPA: hypothetical protein VFM29_03765 [Vicinamibacteria bacterium]|nr:hypothetical protein [Vicinamibacteria bacterium]